MTVETFTLDYIIPLNIITTLSVEEEWKNIQTIIDNHLNENKCGIYCEKIDPKKK